MQAESRRPKVPLCSNAGVAMTNEPHLTANAAAADDIRMPPKVDAAAAEPLRRDKNTLTRAELFASAMEACPALTRLEARALVEHTIEEICETLVRGEPVRLRGFGAFTLRGKAERIGRNPRTGVEAPITPRRVMTFKPSPSLVAIINRARKGK